MAFFVAMIVKKTSTFLVTTNPFDAIPKCHDDGVGGADVTVGATLQS
jgi:hypothetical protein